MHSFVRPARPGGASERMKPKGHRGSHEVRTYNARLAGGHRLLLARGRCPRGNGLMTQDSRALIRDAFEKAKASGRPDWHRMSVAVLKNRILDLTQGLFKESDHGATTFQDFVRQHGDILELDRNTKPPVAILKGVSPEPESTPQRTAVRIRADLWRAVLDFSSHRRYVWDGEEHVARPDDGRDVRTRPSNDNCRPIQPVEDVVCRRGRRRPPWRPPCHLDGTPAAFELPSVSPQASLECFLEGRGL